MLSYDSLPGFLLIELSITLMLSMSILLAFSFFMHTNLEHQKHALEKLELFNKTLLSVERLIVECIVNHKKPENYSVKQEHYSFFCSVEKPYKDYFFYTLKAVGKDKKQTINLVYHYTFL